MRVQSLYHILCFTNINTLPNPPYILQLLLPLLSKNCGIILSILPVNNPIGSMLGDWPSFDPHNFSQLRPSDPSTPSRMTPVTYRPTHDRTLPPPNQVISSEAKNILLRHLEQRAEEKLRPKRAAAENLTPEHGSKHLKASI